MGNPQTSGTVSVRPRIGRSDEKRFLPVVWRRGTPRASTPRGAVDTRAPPLASLRASVSKHARRTRGAITDPRVGVTAHHPAPLPPPPRRSLEREARKQKRVALAARARTPREERSRRREDAREGRPSRAIRRGGRRVEDRRRRARCVRGLARLRRPRGSLDALSEKTRVGARALRADTSRSASRRGVRRQLRHDLRRVRRRRRRLAAPAETRRGARASAPRISRETARPRGGGVPFAVPRRLSGNTAVFPTSLFYSCVFSLSPRADPDPPALLGATGPAVPGPELGLPTARNGRSRPRRDLDHGAGVVREHRPSDDPRRPVAAASPRRGIRV